jgi:hypothetical protein
MVLIVKKKTSPCAKKKKQHDGSLVSLSDNCWDDGARKELVPS